MPEVLPLSADDPGAVGAYTLEGRLGAGGQGTVYVGRDAAGGRVAVKLLHPHLMTDERARQRFLREVDTAKRVAPFCTAQVLDSGFLGGRPYIVSEFVDGPSLQAAVRDDGPRGASALQRLAINTATALAAIHQAGVVHRDFKPGNVLLGPDGPVVIDFGIARALDLSQSAVSSQPIGSPAYMAPEQIAGGEVGPAADLFAWGATMAYAATGRRAFPGDSIPGILHTILQGEPDLGDLRGPLRDLLTACLAKDPAHRPTAAQVIDHLRALPTLPTPALPAPALPAPNGPVGGPGGPTGPGGGGRKAGARRGLVLGTAGVAVLVAALTVYFASAPGATGNQAAGAAQALSTPTSTPTVSPAAPSPTMPPSAQETPTAGATKRSQSAKAVSSTHASPQSTRTRTPQATRTPVDPSTAPATRTPARKATTKPPKTTPPPSDDPPPPAQGSITFNDVHEYCKAQ
ncbi:MAG: protein kinase, partial [Nonomuraea sp.]|nr:protein kinase [Nonomuraea sp.]